MKANNNFWFFMISLVIFLTACTKDEVAPDGPVKDVDGNEYSTVKIGTQVWMMENLKTTRYNDGSGIPIVTDSASWAALTTPGAATFNNTADPDTINTYGRLYNWYAVNTGKVCPEGWHVPTEEEWAILADYLGGAELAGGKLKESGDVYWKSPNTDADNSSGFTALPAGNRGQNGAYYNMGSNAYFWSQSVGFYLNSSGAALSHFNVGKGFGMSVRCIQDSD